MRLLSKLCGGGGLKGRCDERVKFIAGDELPTGYFARALCQLIRRHGASKILVQEVAGQSFGVELSMSVNQIKAKEGNGENS